MIISLFLHSFLSLSLSLSHILYDIFILLNYFCSKSSKDFPGLCHCAFDAEANANLGSVFYLSCLPLVLLYLFNNSCFLFFSLLYFLSLGDLLLQRVEIRAKYFCLVGCCAKMSTSDKEIHVKD